MNTTPKTKIILCISILILSTLACQTLLGEDATPTPPPTNTPLLTPTEEVTPETLNEGEKRYSVTKTENTCTLTVSAPEQTRLVTFSNAQVSISHFDSEGFETYDSIGDHRYLRINDAGRPILAVFTMEGYRLEIYAEGTDVETDSPCGYFTFTLID